MDILNVHVTQVKRLDALIRCESEQLSCYYFDHGTETYIRMQRQVGFSEEPVYFPPEVDALVVHGIGEVCSKLPPGGPLAVAVIDAGWKVDYRDLLQRCCDALAETRPWEVALHLGIEDRPGIHRLVGSPFIVPPFAPPQKSVAASHRAMAVNAGTLMQPLIIHNPDTRPCVFADVPVAYGYIIWRFIRAPHPDENQLYTAYCRHDIGLEHSFTTKELAERTVPRSPLSLTDVVNVYHLLRRNEGQCVSVPMLGFEPRYLSAHSFLTPPADLGSLTIFSYERLLQAHCQILPHARRPEGMLHRECYQCLMESGGRAKFLHLGEDVVSVVTGRYDFNLSLADALTVFQVAAENGYLLL